MKTVLTFIRAISPLWLALIVVVLAAIVVSIGGGGAYDVQALVLLALRVVTWFLIVIGFTRFHSLCEDDDREEDYQRINQGNAAVGIYRGLELFGVSIAAALLIAQV